MKTIFSIEREKDVGQTFSLNVTSLFMRDLHSLLFSEALHPLAFTFKTLLYLSF
jgi:hypothetical protein